MKKITYAILICMILQLFSFVTLADDNAVKPDYSKQISVMSALEILDTSLQKQNPDTEMTRAEFISAVIHLIGLKPDDFSATPRGFNDVTDNTEFFVEINMAYMLGIVRGNGSGLFFPTDKISMNDAISVLINALGYDVFDDGKSTALSHAIDLNLLKNISFNGEGGVTVGQGATLLYNALEVDVATSYMADGKVRISVCEGRNVLNEYLGMEYGSGVITQNAITSLDSFMKKPASKTSVVIDNIIFEVGETDADKLLGYNVQYYYRHDIATGENILVYIRPHGNRVVQVNSEEFRSFSGNKFKYFEMYKSFGTQYKEASLTISSKVDVTYNGVAFPTYTNDDILLKNTSGYNVFIDNNNDSVIDVIHVNRCENYVVDVAVRDDEIIYTSAPKDKLDFSIYDTVEFYLSNGKQVSIDAVLASDVMTVMASKNKSYAKVILSSHSLDLTVVGIDEEANTIAFDNGQEYYMDKSFVPFKELATIGRRASFMFDYRGRLAALNTDNVGMELKYAYLCKAAISGNIDKEVQLKLLNTVNEINVYTLPQKLSFDSQSKTAEEAFNLLTDVDETGERYTKMQMIRYRLNSDKTKVVYIDTSTETAEENGISLKIDTYSNVEFGISWSITHKAAFATPGIVLCIPQVPDELDGVKLPRSLANDFSDSAFRAGEEVWKYLPNRTSKKADVIDPDDAGIANIVVCYYDYLESPPEGGINEAVSQTLRCMVDEVSACLAEDGMPTLKLQYFANGEKSTIIARTPQAFKKPVYDADGNIVPGQFKNLEKGDVIYLYSDFKGRAESAKVLFDISRTDNGRFNAPKRISDTITECGIVYSASDRGFKLLGTLKKDALPFTGKIEDTFDISQARVRKYSESKVSITIYDSENNIVRAGSIADIKGYKDYPDDPSFVVSFVTNYETATVFIID